MNPAEIRRAALPDATAIASLAGQLGHPASIGDSENRLAAALETGNQVVFVACVDGQVIGFIHTIIANRIQSDPFAEIVGFVVDESYRRIGIGGQLLGAAEKWAKTGAVEMLRVRSRSDRKGSREFYQRQGFFPNKKQIVFDKLFKEEP